MPNLDEVLRPEGHGIAAKVMPPRRSLTRVLVVDDELAACRLLSILLGPPDYYCAMASNGEEALLSLQRQPCDRARTTISSNLFWKASLWRALGAHCTSSGSNSKSKTIASISKKWSWSE